MILGNQSPSSSSSLRSEIGKIPLDTVFRERESLNTNIVQQINIAADSWGIDCKRYEIRDITVPGRVKEAMQVKRMATSCSEYV